MWRLVTVLTLALTAGAAPAAAAERTGTRDLAVVTGTAEGDEVQLLAQDTSDGGLCLDVVVGAATRADGSCPRPSTRPRDDLRPRTLTVGASTIVYGAVSRRTAHLELSLYGRRPVRLRTQRGGDYDGRHRDDVRFYAYALRTQPVIAATRALDAKGRGLAAVDLNQLALPPFKGRAAVATLDDELGRPSDLVALDTRILAATAKRPDRRRRALCVGLRRRGAAPVPGRAVCSPKASRVEVRFAADCTSGRSIYYGFAPTIVRRARAVLADGSTRSVRLLAIPGRLGQSARAVLLELASGAVRRVEALGSRGELLATARLSGGDCS